MPKLSRGFMPKCPIFKPVKYNPGESECLAERDGMRFLVTRYRNGNLVAWGVPQRGWASRGRSITAARKAGAVIPISTPAGIKSIDHLLTEAATYMRRHTRARA